MPAKIMNLWITGTAQFKIDTDTCVVLVTVACMLLAFFS